jgi:hypothetical protein
MTDKLYNLLVVLDRFYRKGHVRPMCRKVMNPDDNQHGVLFKNVNTSVCEQFFSFLTKFRYSLRGFNYPTSTLFTLLLFHLKNSHTTGIKTNDFGLGRRFLADKIRPHFLSPCVFESVSFDLDQQRDKLLPQEECEKEADVERLNKEKLDEELDDDEFEEDEFEEDEFEEDEFDDKHTNENINKN